MGIRLSDMHFVYSLAKALAMVSSPAFNVSMLTWSFPVAFPFFIFFSLASTSHVVTDGNNLGQEESPEERGKEEETPAERNTENCNVQCKNPIKRWRKNSKKRTSNGM